MFSLALVIWAALFGGATYATWPKTECRTVAMASHKAHQAAGDKPYQQGATEAGEIFAVYLKASLTEAEVEVYSPVDKPINERYTKQGECEADGQTYYQYHATLPVVIKGQEG